MTLYEIFILLFQFLIDIFPRLFLKTDVFDILPRYFRKLDSNFLFTYQ